MGGGRIRLEPLNYHFELKLLKTRDSRVRHLKVHENLGALCINDEKVNFTFILFDVNSRHTIKTIADVTSAVFNHDGTRIIASSNKSDSHILILDSKTGDELNRINISFKVLHQRIKVDRYRLFTIERLQDGNYVALGAYYKTQ